MAELQKKCEGWMMEMEEHAEEYETSLKRVQESLQAYPELK